MMATAVAMTGASHNENRRELSRRFCGDGQGQLAYLEPGSRGEWLQAHAEYPRGVETASEHELNQTHGLADTVARTQPASSLTAAKVLECVEVGVFVHLLRRVLTNGLSFPN